MKLPSCINATTALLLMSAAVFAPQRVAAFAASTAARECVGDCDNSGSVSIDEIVVGVAIALDSLPLDRCPVFDCNRNSQVTIDCILAAVHAALEGCAAAPTMTSTPTATTRVRTPTSTATTTPSSGNRFVDNGDGTITDREEGLTWEKKDHSAGLHDVNALFPWAGTCTDDQGVPCIGVIGCTLCQPEAAAASTCAAATGNAEGCAMCSGARLCQPINGLTTVWQWLNQLNAVGFAGHNDWRIPTIGRDGGTAQLETIADPSIAGCGSGPPCVVPGFDTGCSSGCTVAECSCTNVGQYWSSTSVAETLPLPSAWSVLFFRGTIGGADKTSGFFTRAVRSVPNAGAK